MAAQAPRISVCMIVKNEAARLKDCLDALAGLADDLVVVDTGSIDASPEIAREGGARVFRHPWTDDFAAARNESIEKANGDWILVLDADEAIDESGRRRIRETVASDARTAYVLPQRNYTADTSLPGWTPCPRDETRAPAPGYVENRQIRLFRSVDALRYRGRVHESLVPDCRRLGVPIQEIDAPVHHAGWMRRPEEIVEKGRRYLAMGLARLSQGDTNTAIAREVASQYLSLGRPTEAARALESVLGQSESAEAHHLLGVAYTQLDRLDEAVSQIELAISAGAAPVEAWVNLGVAHIRSGDRRTARECFDHALESDPDNVAALSNLAVATAADGNTGVALTALSRARAAVPTVARPVVLLVRILAEEGSNDDARREMEALSGSSLFFRPADVAAAIEVGLRLEAFDTVETLLDKHAQPLFSEPDRAVGVARLLRDAHRPGFAQRLLERLLANTPGHAAARNVLGCTLADRRLFAQAIVEFSEAVKIDPDDADYIKNLALACERCGRIRRAVDLYIALARTHPEHAVYAAGRLRALEQVARSSVQS